MALRLATRNHQRIVDVDALLSELELVMEQGQAEDLQNYERVVFVADDEEYACLTEYLEERLELGIQPEVAVDGCTR